MFLSATPPPCHNFVVSAIIFEGFKLRSSNLTHALLIQISRTSLIIDIVIPSKMAAGGHFVKQIFFKSIDLKWPEMWSKVNFGHPKWPTAAILSKISIKKNLYWSKMAYRSEMARNEIEIDFWAKMAPGSHFVTKFQKKICIDLKWPEMWSKMANGRHFVKNFKQN